MCETADVCWMPWTEASRMHALYRRAANLQDHRSLAFAYKAEMDRTFQEINKAKAREDWALTAKYRADVSKLHPPA